MNNSSVKNFFEQNLKLLMGLLGFLVVIAAILLVVQSKHEAKEREAANTLFETRKMTDPLVQARDYKTAAGLLQTVVEKFPGTRASYETNLLIADLYVDAKMAEKSIDYYARAAKDAPDNFTKILALYSKGIAEESAGKASEAVQSLDAAMKTTGSQFLSPEIMMAQARSYEAMKNFAKAAEVYKTIQEKFATKTYYSSAAAAFLAKINSALTTNK